MSHFLTRSLCALAITALALNLAACLPTSSSSDSSAPRTIDVRTGDVQGSGSVHIDDDRGTIDIDGSGGAGSTGGSGKVRVGADGIAIEGTGGAGEASGTGTVDITPDGIRVNGSGRAGDVGGTGTVDINAGGLSVKSGGTSVNIDGRGIDIRTGDPTADAALKNLRGLFGSDAGDDDN